MNIIGIFGEMGKGKTLTAVILGLIYKQKGYEIYSNMKNFLDSKYIDDLDDLKDLDINTKRLLILDEIYVYIDSRNSSTKRNKAYSYLIFQSRKRNFDIIYTAQLYSAVDKRLRNLTNIIIEPEINLEKNILKIKITKTNGTEKVYIIKNINKYFKYYESNEIIEDDLK